MRWCSCSEVITVAPASCSYSNTQRQSVVFNLQFQFQKPLFKFKSLSSLSLSHRKLLVVPAAQAQPSSPTADFDFVVVNFYHFVFIKDPQAEIAKHLSFLHLQVRHFLSFCILLMRMNAAFTNNGSFYVIS